METEQYLDSDLCHTIIGAAIDVHKQLGPGLLESVYEACLNYELTARNINFSRQWSHKLIYKNIKLAERLRVDFLVENRVVLELKAVDNVLPVHEAQLLSYLKLLNKRVGLLINFNVPVLKNGITRRVI